MGTLSRGGTAESPEASELGVESVKVALAFTSLVPQMLAALINKSKGDLDHATIVTFIGQMSGVEVKRETSANCQHHAA